MDRGCRDNVKDEAAASERDGAARERVIVMTWPNGLRRRRVGSGGGATDGQLWRIWQAGRKWTDVVCVWVIDRVQVCHKSSEELLR